MPLFQVIKKAPEVNLLPLPNESRFSIKPRHSVGEGDQVGDFKGEFVGIGALLVSKNEIVDVEADKENSGSSSKNETDTLMVEDLEEAPSQNSAGDAEDQSSQVLTEVSGSSNTAPDKIDTNKVKTGSKGWSAWNYVDSETAAQE